MSISTIVHQREKTTEYRAQRRKAAKKKAEGRAQRRGGKRVTRQA